MGLGTIIALRLATQLAHSQADRELLINELQHRLKQRRRHFEAERPGGDTRYGLRKIAEPLGFLLAFRHETPLRGAPERLPV